MLYYIKMRYESKWMHFGKVGSRNDLKGYLAGYKGSAGAGSSGPQCA